MEEESIPEPIIILSPGRAGSSMLAGIFALHGCWWGQGRRADKWNPKGYFENREILRLLYREMGRYWLKPLKHNNFKFKGKIHRIIKDQGYEGGPWFIKLGALYKEAFWEFNPQYIFALRDINAVYRSYQKCGFLSRYKEEEQQKVIVDNLQVINDTKGLTVWTDKLVEGDHTEVKAALEACGLEYDKEIIDNFVDKTLYT